MSYKEEIIKQINEMTEEEIENLMILNDEAEEDKVSDSRLIELEIQKELNRMENEKGFDDFILNLSEKESAAYKNGLINGLKYAGIYRALIKAGMTLEQAYQIALNESTISGNIRIAKVSGETTKYSTNVMGFQEVNPYDDYYESGEEYE